MASESDFRVPFLDLRVDDPLERAAILEAIGRVLDHGRLMLGPEVDMLEERIAGYCGRMFGIGLGSGTDAIYVALRALGVGADDEVITSPLSWLASGTAISLTGATPVFADIGDDLNIDANSVEGLIGARTKAVMPVHYAGTMCDMAALQEISGRRGIPLVEDASQAFGARLSGRPAGGFGDIAVFSLNPMKLLAACGESGIAITDDQGLADRMRRLRYHGMIDKDATDTLSINARIDTVQAAILLSRLDGVEDEIERRRVVAKRYTGALGNLVTVPREPEGDGNRAVWFTYVIQTQARDRLLENLARAGIEAKVRDKILVPDQPLYDGKAKGRYDKASGIIGSLVSLPIHKKMTDDDVDYVVASVASFFNDIDA